MGENTRTALVGIVVENEESVEKLNALLHEYRSSIIGRMGVPQPEKGISLISVAMDADQNTISALSGKLGALEGVSTKTIYSKK
ncbi:MAG: iron-only hydrogenase system regulator [Eubacterium sp.]|nr:iron-only hydrogenase system regulator [Candidatus Colimonas fimequi]